MTEALNLDLSQLECTLKSASFQPQKHGPDWIPACSLRFEAHIGRPQADLFARMPLPLWTGDNEDVPAANFEQIKLGTEHERMRLRLHDAIGGDEPFLIITEAKVNGIRLEPQDGAEADISFRVQFEPDEEQCGALAMRIMDTLFVSAERQKADVEDIAA